MVPQGLLGLEITWKKEHCTDRYSVEGKNWKFNVWLVVGTEEAVIPHCNYSHLIAVINCRYEQAEVNAAFRFPIHPFIVRILNFMQGTIRLFKLVLIRWLVNIIIVDVKSYEQLTAGSWICNWPYANSATVFCFSCIHFFVGTFRFCDYGKFTEITKLDVLAPYILTMRQLVDREVSHLYL